jgi:hypothetical protein
MLVLGAIITIGFFTLLGILMYKEIKPINESLLNIAIGALMSAFITVVGYFFGSSHGSKIKNDILNKNTFSEG